MIYVSLGVRRGIISQKTLILKYSKLFHSGWLRTLWLPKCYETNVAKEPLADYSLGLCFYYKWVFESIRTSALLFCKLFKLLQMKTFLIFDVLQLKSQSLWIRQICTAVYTSATYLDIVTPIFLRRMAGCLDRRNSLNFYLHAWILKYFNHHELSFRYLSWLLIQ